MFSYLEFVLEFDEIYFERVSSMLSKYLIVIKLRLFQFVFGLCYH
jgi:hypothetical protein